MKHDFLPLLIDFDYRIAPTEIGVQVVEADWHLHRCYRRQKPCWIHEKHRRPPFRNAFFRRLVFIEYLQGFRVFQPLIR